ncbi:MAG TPA: phosphoribosylaminoimidazolesuccinocarboxamide synthase, partial [Saprospiraceae bacterium]|nr:phosphoribosylaminoimidazolesuccinocarboxamide synthase [Saprospiraceae bacterium]
MSEQTVSNKRFSFPGQTDFYRGKVRDVYYFGEHMAIVVTDRISAFDHILPEPIPYKGQILNTIAAHFLNQTSDIVPNWLEQVPHPNVSMGKVCKPIKLEMVVRAHLTGH